MSRYLVSKLLYDILVEDGRVGEYMSYVKQEEVCRIRSLYNGQWLSAFIGDAGNKMKATRSEYRKKLRSLELHNNIERNKVIKKESVTFERIAYKSLSFDRSSFFIKTYNDSNILSIYVDNELLLTDEQSELIFHYFDSSILDSILDGEHIRVSPYFDKVFSKESLNNIKEAYAEQITNKN